jgi:O-antigen/teichoic acid export membrane protein
LGGNPLKGIETSASKKIPIRLQTVIALKEKLVSILKRSPEPVIALSAIFEALGYTGITGIGWGILGGFVVSVAIELGYDVRQIGGRYILFKSSKKDTIKNGKSRK